ncbi:uncharacterized protein BDV17DRAFT_117420 [Aspergillus undulatus]|uniref:uncharacterized protein n=1 Tax=Aspergillus undulatus TaxID=1810928 RepID=UPI003CCCC397
MNFHVNSRKILECSSTLSVEIFVGDPGQTSTQPYVPSVLTGEKISGTVAITATQSDLSFGNVHIWFQGEESTDIPSSKPDKATHQFLKIVQPVDYDALFSPKVFKRGKRYEVPFVFSVPDYLLPASCRHSDPLVRAAHLHLPPSCGDATIAGFGGKLRDDSAPDACKVVYSINVKIERPDILSGIQYTMLERRLKVRIKPAVGEVPLPDLHTGSRLADEDCLYQQQSVKTATGAGSLAMTLEQPERFWHPLRDPISLISKAIRIVLVYTGAGATPPELKSLRAQIIVTTIYTTSLDSETHPPPKKRDFFNRPVNFRDAELALSIPSIPRVRWTLDETGSYTATLLVPVTLPKDKSFVPTFHSCLISRVYSLAFQISVKGAAEPWKLRAPMQIAAERDPSLLPSYNASVGVIDASPTCFHGIEVRQP